MARALRASASAIAIAVVAVTLVAFVLSLVVSDRYRATARIVTDTSAASPTSADTDQRRLATNVALLTTPDVLAAAARNVPGENGDSLRGKISTSVATDADVIDVTATDDSAEGAAAIANSVARTFLDRRAAGERADIAKARDALEGQLATLGTGGASADQAAAIRTRLSELVVDGANAGNDLQLAELAQPPSAPYAPRPWRNAAIAFFAALFVAILAGWCCASVCARRPGSAAPWSGWPACCCSRHCPKRPRPAGCMSSHGGAPDDCEGSQSAGRWGMRCGGPRGSP